MPLREGPEFLRGHLGHPSARMSLSPDTKGLFFGAGGRGSFLYKRLSLDDPRPQGGQVLRPGSPGHPWGQAVPGGIGWGGSPGNRL
jgi:hypothetical protein